MNRALTTTKLTFALAATFSAYAHQGILCMLDAGGQHAASASYSVGGSIGTIGGVSSAGSGTVEQGYVGQFDESDGWRIESTLRAWFLEAQPPKAEGRKLRRNSSSRPAPSSLNRGTHPAAGPKGLAVCSQRLAAQERLFRGGNQQ